MERLALDVCTGCVILRKSKMAVDTDISKKLNKAIGLFFSPVVWRHEFRSMLSQVFSSINELILFRCCGEMYLETSVINIHGWSKRICLSLDLSKNFRVDKNCKSRYTTYLDLI